MKHKFFYGAKPTYTDADKKEYSRGGFECRALMKDRKGAPVVISESIVPEFPYWKVEYGFSCVLFATRDEAMAFCERRFTR